MCDCPRPCSFIRYSVALSASQLPSLASLPFTMKYLNFTDEKKLRENILELRVYFESDLVRRESHVAQYTAQTYLSSLGGQMGICMGASLISLVELLEALMYTGLVLSRRCLNKLRTVAQREQSKTDATRN
ncbi:acid-sensing ion channel 3 [Plakobranchus ocellatus]|uniref:Acid-sensing ion channel 3 n=1 Tax=Plakobranchus ocellatus TaxID=259542 RepID=A0AAV4A0V6_9GAST|nr:acid-sensing ion channel 3 [Plakobranchus ocellatus]